MAGPKQRLIWSDDAEEDLISIWRYGADEWSPAAADTHLEQIGRACDRLIDKPELGRARDELLRGTRSVLVDPHVVFYRITTRGVEVMRVLHQREDIETIFH